MNTGRGQTNRSIRRTSTSLLALGLQNVSPYPNSDPLNLSHRLDRSRSSNTPPEFQKRLQETPTPNTPTESPTSRNEAAVSIRGQMIALQEELDWHCYQLYGQLLVDDHCYASDELPEVALGHVELSRSSWQGRSSNANSKPRGSSDTARRRSPRFRHTGQKPIAKWSSAASR